MEIGDCVRIKNGVLDPDFEKYDMSGWQGRIIETDFVNGITFEIELDSFTLKKVPRQYIYDSLDDGCDYAIMYVSSSDVIKVEPRDTVDEVRAVRKEMNEKLDYVSVLDEDEAENKRFLEMCNFVFGIRKQGISNEDVEFPSLN
ncbi:MAG: hypothetical protein HY951_03470 [Bacteroidia bacterium]|nr:hypothetical protein [Bacteroidia bacterium]